MKNTIAIFWLILGMFGRLIPHAPNMTPLTSMSLFAGRELSKWQAVLVMIATMVCSDLMLSAIYGYAPFGGVTLFTYSAFTLITLAGSRLKANSSALRTAGFVLGSSVFFWVWTVFGSWMFGLDINNLPHAKTIEGLVACYVAALPFLRNALIGDAVWSTVFFLSYALVAKKALAGARSAA